MTLLTGSSPDPTDAACALPYDEHERLSTREALDRRVAALLPYAVAQQLWLLLFDEDDVQMPAMIPIGDLPLFDGDGDVDGEGIGELLVSLDREFGVSTFVFVLERPGRGDPSPEDRRWLTYLLAAAAGRPFGVRAVYLCHDGGVCRHERGGGGFAGDGDGDGGGAEGA